MIVIIGLVILIAAVLVGVAGVFANGGSTHPLTDDFAVFGYHVTGSTGVLFLYGIVVGGIGIAGLGMLLAGARRTARRGRSARRELKTSRRNTTVDDARLPDPQQPISTTDVTADAPGNAAGQGADNRPAPRKRGLGQLFGHTPAGPEPAGNPRGGQRR
ncbi:hypothetical protein OG563_26080 [Nocardia vinacea]|uniref:Integral membrane protein n=1 Tax=Nocardia vinacea TaxID=96468 RepID=A0ABZ1YID2_9NOCA|nr:hypothetical protein [Nocardia vinacea]